MPFKIRPYRRFPVQYLLTYNAGPFQGQGTVWDLSCTVGAENQKQEWLGNGRTPTLLLCSQNARPRKEGGEEAGQSLCSPRPHDKAVVA